jgi:hypothetical protein
MTRALGPSVGLGREAALPFGVLALCWLPVGIGGLIWVAGHAASSGPVIATSNKADLWGTTADPRARETGEPVWVFDPQRITGVEREWWWNPLRGVTSVEEAHRLAEHFVQEVRGDRGDRDFWTSAALDLLTGLLLAVALSGRGLNEMYEWLNDPVLSTPAQVLREHGQKAAAASLSGRQHGAPETRDGTFGRPIGGEIRWCAQWREHAEAIGRLEALWRSWEALRLDPGMCMATWLTNYLDPQLAVLLGRGGPFAQCNVDRHERQVALSAPG